MIWKQNNHYRIYSLKKINKIYNSYYKIQVQKTYNISGKLLVKF